MQLVRALYPEVEPLIQLGEILDDIAERGQDQVLAELRAAQNHAALLQRWLQTPTWWDSRRFLQQHPELISEPRTLASWSQAATTR